MTTDELINALKKAGFTLNKEYNVSYIKYYKEVDKSIISVLIEPYEMKDIIDIISTHYMVKIIKFCIIYNTDKFTESKLVHIINYVTNKTKQISNDFENFIIDSL